jgi:nicotinamide phosphoribosyltransferase
MSIINQIRKTYGIASDTDSYKLSHFLAYPEGTDSMMSYIESRGGDFDETVFFGLQLILKEYFSEKMTMAQVENMKAFAEAHGEPFNYEGWKYIVEKYDGIIPIKVRAVPEGTVVPVKNVLCTIETTVPDPMVFWAVSYFETKLLRIWYTITVATLSREMKKVIMASLRRTSDDPEGQIGFGLLDFGSRGCTTMEQVAFGGAAHLVNFLGSDSIAGIMAANIAYNSKMSGFSVPATEHSVMCAWGKDREAESFEHMIDTFSNFPIISVVSDTWNIFEACEKWNLLADKIKDSGKTLVVRPDSGNHVEVLSKMYPILEKGFGSIVNSKGYKVLNNVKILWGDGIEFTTVQTILDAVTNMGYSTETIILGSGGGLLQKVNRDTQKFAMKCSSIRLNGEWVNISKDPITDPGKTSKKGRLTLVKNEESGDMWTAQLPFSPSNPYIKEVLVDVWENGELLQEWTFDEVRNRAAL